MSRTIVSLEAFDEKVRTFLAQNNLCVKEIERGRMMLREISSIAPEVLICRDRDAINLILQSCPRLKMVFIVEVGVEDLPFSLLKEKGVRVANTGGISNDIISNYVLNCVLAQSSKLKESIMNQQRHVWKRFQCTDSLIGKNFLIVGAGKIGKEIAKKASTFGLIVYGIQRNPEYTECFKEMATLEKLDEYLPLADYVVCTMPQTPLTLQLFDYNRFAKMKPTASFINVSRGAIVKEEDIIKALDNNLFAQAYLDVFENEPLPTESPLWDHSKIQITPHQAGRLSNYMLKAIELFTLNYQAYVQGKKMPNEIDLDAGY